MAKSAKNILWFSEVDKDDIPLVGGKGANLGEMTSARFPVPNGFIVSSTAYYNFIKQNNLGKKIEHLLKTVNFDKTESLTQVSFHIRKIIEEGEISQELALEIFKSYKRLNGVLRDPLVAVRSSATAEDLPQASFAGQQETFLNVQGEANLIQKIKKGWASLFNDRAIFYRREQKINDFRVGIAIVVQKMVASDSSGVMFTIDPVTNSKSKIVIEAIYGLGEYIVGGKVTPDHYEVAKEDEKIIAKNITSQDIMLVKKGARNAQTSVPFLKKKRQKISDSQIKTLAEIGKKLEKHYYFPQDIEWAIEKGKIYIVQTRPVTTIANGKSQMANSEKNDKLYAISHTLLVKGDPASPGIASGPVRILKNAKEIHKIIQGEVLVAPQTNPDFVPAMKKAVAIVTDSGGRTSHAAIVSRELGIPAIVGAKNATKVLKTGVVVTVNGIKGEVYKGGAIISSKFKVQSSKFNDDVLKTATKVYVNLAEPEKAAGVAAQNVDGVGLLRAEFMMAGIGVHPKKLIHDGKKQVFVNKLSENLEQFAKAFSPRPVVYRTSDFKTSEYRSLIGGRDYEPQEVNPMLGYRGAFRYKHDAAVFNLELDAIKKVREKGHKNIWVMLPFVRTVRELIDVKKLISESGLYRSDSFKLWMMVEIPSNVILLEKFIEAGIDGVSIGSNDLTMLILGTDRDNSEVAHEFNEQDQAVLWAIERVIKIANKYKITSSICGQAPSLYPSLVEKLVHWGITSVSVSPDAVESVRKTIHEYEKKLLR